MEDVLTTHMLLSTDDVECTLYVVNPSGGTFALNTNLYLVVEACGANVFEILLCQAHTGDTWECMLAFCKSVTITSGRET